MIEQSNSTGLAPSNTRCSHRFANHKRCRLPILDEATAFCAQHATHPQNLAETQDVSSLLLEPDLDFQSAQSINASLTSLYRLLAQNRIATGRAGTLAYIASLMLRTLPVIDRQLQRDEDSAPVIIDFSGLPRPNRTPHPIAPPSHPTPPSPWPDPNSPKPS